MVESFVSLVIISFNLFCSFVISLLIAVIIVIILSLISVAVLGAFSRLLSCCLCSLSDWILA